MGIHMKPIRTRTGLFLAFSLVSAGLFYPSLAELLRLSLGKGHAADPYSYIVMIPFVSVFLFWRGRESILADCRYAVGAGVAGLAAGGVLYGLGRQYGASLNPNDHLSLTTFAFLVWWMGGFICFYGAKAFKKGIFPLGFLLFMVPIPSFVLGPYVTFLQRGSAEVSYLIFKLLGVPVFREGVIFRLTGLSIEVAKECSGIRASLALIITVVLSGYFVLQTVRYRLLFVLCVVPVAIVKNGLRIVMLGLLGAYVDKIYITNHWLHRSGGIPFFILALVLVLFPLLWALSRAEKRHLNRRAEKFKIAPARMK